jgi:tetratricopeptide (TPR) repeat protein
MSWEALKEKGNALFKEKRYEDAIKFYEKALDINSSQEVLYSNKGTCKKCLKEYKDAINDYKKALEINPKNTKNMNRLASVYIIT